MLYTNSNSNEIRNVMRPSLHSTTIHFPTLHLGFDKIKIFPFWPIVHVQLFFLKKPPVSIYLGR
jgi:hypothetical protein